MPAQGEDGGRRGAGGRLPLWLRPPDQSAQAGLDQGLDLPAAVWREAATS